MFKNSRLRKKFFKAFLFTLIIGLGIVGAALVVLRNAISPPSIPVHAEQPFIPEVTFRPSPDRPAFEVVDAHPDDAYIEVNAPVGWTRKENFFTLLVFGYDEGLNTDTIMVAAFDVANGEAYIISIPRDTRVPVQRNVQRINSAFPVGRQGGRGHAGGVAQLKREVQTLIGFMPDFYVSVEESAFERLIDAVGGVTLNVPFHMHYIDPIQNLYINIPAGEQRLSGRQALHFARYRYGSNPARTISDYRRMQHQQQLIAALMDELLTPRTILRIPELINTYRDHVNTDLTLTQLLWFGEQFVTGNVTLNAYNFPTTSILDRHWYEIPNRQEAIELVNRTINPFTRDLWPENFQFVR
ncbi:MAG: LCP family protein [Defluviitaleaceae bacterium]|nr:LCP family protein [Defluviitaleaceae bacterium]MCL2275619.1 LCP family protein [Defluviitaleaceae bacterium]